MTDEQARAELWSAVVNLEFFKSQITVFHWIDRGARTVLAVGTLAGVSPIIRGLQQGVIDALSWVSIGCGLTGLIVLPAFGISRRIEVLNEWKCKWVDIREFYHEALKSANATRTAKFSKGKTIEVAIEKDTRHYDHPFEEGIKKRAEKRALDWFKNMGLA